jgi:hypothetical protein
MKDLVRRTLNGVNYLLTGEVAAPAGSNTQLQYNNSGTMAGDPNLIWDNVNKNLELGASSSSGIICLYGNATADPPAEPSRVIFFIKSIALKFIPKWIGPTGASYFVQPSLSFSNVRMVGPASGTTAATCMTAINTAFVNTATTITQPAIANTSIKTKVRSVVLASSTSAGNVVSHRSTMQEVLGAVGYFFSTRFYINALAVTTNRGFFGLWGNANVASNVDPLTDISVAKIGLGFTLTAGTGTWRIISSTTSAVTATDLGATMPVNITDIMELVLYCAPGTTTVGYRVTNLTTAAVVTGTIVSNVPAVTIPLAVNFWQSNDVVGVVVGFGMNKWYLETDY